MSEEILNKIFDRLDLITRDQAEMKHDITGMKQDITGMKNDITSLQQDTSEMKQDITGMKKDISGMKHDITTLQQDTSEIKLEQHNMKQEINEIKKQTEDIPAMKVAILETNEVVKRIELVQEKQETTLDLLSRRSLDQEAEIKRIR